MRPDDRAAVTRIRTYYHTHVEPAANIDDLLLWLNGQLAALENEMHDDTPGPQPIHKH